jgi:hypothetical protein
MSDDETERFERQIRLFGELGQEKLRGACVAVVGLGGLGSHVVQQLSYLGVRRFVLIDHDIVTATSLNRLIGATGGDLGRAKVAVAADLIRQIQPDVDIDSKAMKLSQPRAAIAASASDLIMGCVDNDYPRLLMTDLASAASVSYIDAASGIDTKHGVVYGGRVVAAGVTRGCLSCLGLLDQTEIRRAQMSSDELETEAKIYGVPVESLTATGPSVVTLNGVVASLAAMEAMVSMVGLRAPVKFQRYQGHWSGLITRSETAPDACFYCDRWLGVAHAD